MGFPGLFGAGALVAVAAVVLQGLSVHRVVVGLVEVELLDLVC